MKRLLGGAAVLCTIAYAYGVRLGFRQALSLALSDQALAEQIEQWVDEEEGDR